MSDEKPIIHLLLLSPGLNQLVGGKLAVTEVLQNLALLLGFAKDLELTAPQVLELVNLVVPRSDSPGARSVAGQLKLHFRCGHALVEFLLHLAQGIGPIQFRVLPLLLRLNQLASDGCKALALAPLKTLATTEHGFQRKAEGHGATVFWVRGFGFWLEQRRQRIPFSTDGGSAPSLLLRVCGFYWPHTVLNPKSKS